MILSRGAHSTLSPGVLCSRAQSQSVERRGDLLIGKLASHFTNCFYRFKARTAPMFTESIFFNPQLGMAAAGPVQQQEDFLGSIVDISNDLMNQDANNPLLQSHVRSRRVPDGWKILRKAQENLLIGQR